MSIARRDDRHNADLAKEIADSFNRAVRPPRGDENDADNTDNTDGTEPERPRFVVTGDRRVPERKPERDR
ncbi:hypothetical protein B0I33_112151 [Prauserella shujinwangii]|uniref:Uncharacterized protein n=1 Tax=Prauserella shujinwangii TaxID=1453103 RepID=A0A2T0LMG7_9PSEU|nr:hypothetical protein [Prauserella shujinwangii]PRX44273.1 hypothetical protein B0I33_112151 [Prauserella shujinwangii]